MPVKAKYSSRAYTSHDPLLLKSEVVARRVQELVSSVADIVSLLVVRLLLCTMRARRSEVGECYVVIGVVEMGVSHDFGA